MEVPAALGPQAVAPALKTQGPTSRAVRMTLDLAKPENKLNRQGGLSWPRITGISFAVALHAAALLMLLAPLSPPTPNADKFEQANVLLEDAYKRGMLTEGKELRSLYVGYMNARRWNEAKAVMDAGTSKGILQATPQLAKDYMVLAQSAYAENNIPLAIEMYTKAGPIAADGEAFLNLAKVLEYSGKKVDAKAAAQKALDKGVKKPEEAKRILAR